MPPRSASGCSTASSGIFPTPEIALLRHPRVSVPPGFCYGRLDVPLAPGWARWAASVLPRLQAGRFRSVVSSPAARCRRPATLIARVLAIPLRLDDRLTELDFGSWEGLPWDGIDPAILREWADAPLDFTPPGGEPIPALVARVRSFTREIASEPDTVVLTHGGPLRLLDRMLLGMPLDPDRSAPPPGTVTVIRTA